ncbi:phage tail spike protein [Paenisporosarcina sp. TG-14]|uniref:phage tail spike protein n=1 Tax=Paenisporosarcina sp. TG-14 TaxID=1231057 RepID=UPI0003020027|nr:phage tail spike protein [Paenisporosarcina sp. TG-14]
MSDDLLVLYDLNERFFTSFGLGVLAKARKINVRKVMNDMYTLDFVIGKQERNSGKLIEGRFIKANETVFIIRKIEEVGHGNTADCYVFCEHIITELLEKRVPAFSKLRTITTDIGIEILKGTRFKLVPDVEKTHSIVQENSNSMKQLHHLAAIGNFIILPSGLPDVNGIFTIVYRQNTGKQIGFFIYNEKNAKRIHRTTDGANVVTRLYPVGSNGLTIARAAANSKGLIYMDSVNLSSYAYPREVEVEFSEIADPDALYEAGLEFLSKHDKPIFTYEVEIDDLTVEASKVIELGDIFLARDDNLGFTADVMLVSMDQEIGTNKVICGFDTRQKNLADLFNQSFEQEENKEVITVDANKELMTLNSTFQEVAKVNVTAASPTILLAGVNVLLNVTSGGLLEGSIVLNTGIQIIEIKQTLTAGWHTLGVPFSIPELVAGSSTIQLNLKMSSGLAIVDMQKAKMYVRGDKLLSATQAGPPGASINEPITINAVIEIIEDIVVHSRQIGILNYPKDAMDLETTLTFNDTATVIVKTE